MSSHGIYVPEVGDRVCVHPNAVEKLGIPPGVAGSGATVAAIDDHGRPIVRLDAEPWATPREAWREGGREDGWELLPADIYPIAEPPAWGRDLELIASFWAVTTALEVWRPDPSLGIAHYVLRLVEEAMALRRRVAELEVQVEEEADRVMAEAGLPHFDVDAPMPPTRRGGPGDAIARRHRKDAEPRRMVPRYPNNDD